MLFIYIALLIGRGGKKRDVVSICLGSMDWMLMIRIGAFCLSIRYICHSVQMQRAVQIVLRSKIVYNLFNMLYIRFHCQKVTQVVSNSIVSN
ncbi:MAG: hypothetical protein C4527_05070 [Candidatus Omnitrophota bacterium]|nr:MAG: hypothetical protein C4527_05070 [Candidatus Omnitrophota bacterium]